jgi:hypothetical protein
VTDLTGATLDEHVEEAPTACDQQMDSGERIALLHEQIARIDEQLAASPAVSWIREFYDGRTDGVLKDLALCMWFFANQELVKETADGMLGTVEAYQAARDEAVAALAELDGTADRATEVEAREVAVAERESAVTEREQEMDAREERIREHFSIGAARG